jgi:Trk K+ transport system NAD-binding subunit
LDSIYFVIVTISTVGFGDIAPKSELTKLVSIILIVTGISSVAILSQGLIDSIIRSRLKKTYELPKKPIKLTNHIVIVDYQIIGYRIAHLLRHRRYTIIVIDQDEHIVKQAEFDGFSAIKSDISQPNVLKILNLAQTTALIFTISNDTLALRTSILARNIQPDINIFGILSHSSAYKVAKIVGMKYVSIADSLGSRLALELQNPSIIDLQKINNPEREFFINSWQLFLALKQFNRFEDKTETFELGSVHKTTRSFITKRDNFNNDPAYKLIARNRNHVFNGSSELFVSTKRIITNRVIFVGFPLYIFSTINELKLEKKQVIIISATHPEKEMAEKNGFTVYEWNFDIAEELMRNLIWENDLIIDAMEDITASLIITSLVNEIQTEPRIIQIAHFEHEVEIYHQSGAMLVINPQEVVSQKLLASFLDFFSEYPSYIFTNAHIFEVTVKEGDDYCGKQINQFDKLKILLIKSKSGKSISMDHNDEYKIKKGDHLLVGYYFRR